MATDQPQRDAPVGDAHLLGPFDGARLQRALPDQPGQGADRALHRLRPAHPDRLRPRRPRGGRRGRQGRRPGGPPGPHEGAARGHPRGVDEHLHDDQRHRGVAARPLRGARAGAGRRPGAAGGHDAERHRQGVPEPGDLHLPARSRACASPSTPSPTPCATRPDGTRSTSAATTCRRRAPRRCRRSPTRWPPPSACSTACGTRARSRRRGAAGRGRPHQLLRELERPLRGGDLQDAGLHRAVGPHLPRALRGRGPQAAPLPLRRAGELARADRAAAREQRAAHRARVARRHPVQERPGPGHAAAGLERGARAAPAVGPAVVPAHAAGAGLRVGPARVRRHLRGLGRRRGQDGRAGGGRHGRAGRRGGARRAPSRRSTS